MSAQMDPVLSQFTPAHGHTERQLMMLWQCLNPNIQAESTYEAAMKQLNEAEHEVCQDSNRLCKAISMQKQFAFILAKSTGVRRRIVTGLKFVELARSASAHADQMMNPELSMPQRVDQAALAVKHIKSLDSNGECIQKLVTGQQNEQSQHHVVTTEVDRVKNKLQTFWPLARANFIKNDLCPWLQSLKQATAMEPVTDGLSPPPLPTFHTRQVLADVEDHALSKTFEAAACVVSIVTEAAQGHISGDHWATLMEEWQQLKRHLEGFRMPDDNDTMVVDFVHTQFKAKGDSAMSTSCDSYLKQFADHVHESIALHLGDGSTAAQEALKLTDTVCRHLAALRGPEHNSLAWIQWAQSLVKAQRKATGVARAFE